MTEFEEKIISAIEFHALKESLESFAILIDLDLTVREDVLFKVNCHLLTGVYENSSLILSEDLLNLANVRRMYLKHCSVNGFDDNIFRRSNFYCFTVPNVLSGNWIDIEYDEGSFQIEDHLDCVLWIPEVNFLRRNRVTKMSNIDYFNYYIRVLLKDIWTDINGTNFNKLK